MKRLGAVVAVGVALALCVPCRPASAQAGAKPDAAAKAITWKEAMGRVGEEVVVEGKVVNVRVRKGKGPDTLNFEKNWKESLSVAVFDKEKFGDLQAKYTGRKIRVKGKVTEYRGAARIKVNDPAQIAIVE